MVEVKKSDVLAKIRRYKGEFVSDELIVTDVLTLHARLDRKERQPVREQIYNIIDQLSKEKNEDYHIETVEILTMERRVVGRKYVDTSHNDYPHV